VLERRPLVRTQVPPVEGGRLGRLAQRSMPPARHRFGLGQSHPLLLAHGPRRVPAHSLAGLAIEEGQHLGVAQHVALHCQVLALVLQVPCQEAVEITLAEGGVVAGECRQHLGRIARCCCVLVFDRLRPQHRLRARCAHPDRPHMLLRHRARRIDPQLEPVQREVAVLVLPPQLAPALALGHHRPAADPLHLGLELARLARRQMITLHPPGRDQEMRVPVRPLRLHVPRMRRVHVQLHRQPAADEVLEGEAAHQLDPVLMAELAVRRQRHHQLARHLRVLASASRLRTQPPPRQNPTQRSERGHTA
jgi:hypothetical protein